MRKFLRIFLLLTVLASGTLLAAPVGAAPPTPARATVPDVAPAPGPCVDGALPSGGLSRICVPAAGWNGDLIVYAHGYTAFNAPLDFYNLTLPDGTYLPALVQSLGFAFATTSYRRNGLAILEGVDDVRELVAQFVAGKGQPGRTYIVGPSEGGAVAALSAERSADIFDAGLSLCGPIGDFRKQINYWGDFRVLYDYFFPDVLPGDAMHVPDALIANWDTGYQPAALAALADQTARRRPAHPHEQRALRPGRPQHHRRDHRRHPVVQRLRHRGRQAAARRHPLRQPGPHLQRLAQRPGAQRRVDRFTADPKALAQLQKYQTTGNPAIPLITLHTTGDPIVPYWHQIYYRGKLTANHNTNVTQVKIFRYGHSAFTTTEVLAGFSLMVLRAGASQMYVPPQYDESGVRAMERSALGQ